jgi:hypothetical protein
MKTSCKAVQSDYSTIRIQTFNLKLKKTAATKLLDELTFSEYTGFAARSLHKVIINETKFQLSGHY